MMQAVGAKTILLVEDDPHERRIYGDLLWYNGFDVINAATLEQGYWLAVEGEPDLIVLDLALPDGDGLALCRRLKAEPTTASIPVVVLSARPERTHGERAAAAGCVLYLEKPKPPVQLVDEIVQLIGPAPPGGVPPNRRQQD